MLNLMQSRRRGPAWRAIAQVALLTLAGQAWACSSSDTEETAENSSHTSSTQGHFVASFQPTPAEPIVGKNTMEIHLEDANDAAVVGATLSVEPWMPGMGHGSSTAPVVTETGHGHYGVADIVYTMAGAWELKIEVAAGGVTDNFVLTYDVK